MDTSISRQGAVTELKRMKDKTNQEKKNHCVISFRGGYVKFVMDDKDFQDGLMLQDKAEITITIKDDETK